jgi:hypothetical protein
MDHGASKTNSRKTNQGGGLGNIDSSCIYNPLPQKCNCRKFLHARIEVDCLILNYIIHTRYKKSCIFIQVFKLGEKSIAGHALPARGRDRLSVCFCVMMASFRGRGEKIQNMDLKICWKQEVKFYLGAE